MSKTQSLHAAQRAILEVLRHAPSARFSDMMRAARMESDVFKFHIRGFVRDGVVEKLPDGRYRLTARGKEYANSLDESRLALRQPKLSLLLVVRSLDGEILLHRRLRHPFYGYIGLLSGPARWGDDFTETATAELRKQSGLAAEFHLAGVRRERDLNMAGDIREDKVFFLLEATVDGDPEELWHGGETSWYEESGIANLDKVFPATLDCLEQMHVKQWFRHQDIPYSDTDY